MKRILVLFMLLIFEFPTKVKAVQQADSSSQLKSSFYGEDFQMDERFFLLNYYLKSRNSPLTEHSVDFIKAADAWGLDWRLMPAITGLESCFGRRLIEGYYNPFGWAGGYYQFDDYRQAIYHVAEVLQKKYYAYGRDNPYKIGPVYAPPNPKWGGLVDSIMKDISPYNSN